MRKHFSVRLGVALVAAVTFFQASQARAAAPPLSDEELVKRVSKLLLAVTDTYDLRGPAPEKGQVIVKKTTFKMKDADLTIKIGEKTLDAKQSISSSDEEEIQFLAVSGRQVTKALTTILKDHTDVVTNTGGEDSKESKNGDLDGAVILSDRTGPGKWKHHLVDEKPTEKQNKDLAKRAGLESDDIQYPEAKVKVGHAWTVDAALLSGLIGGSITDLKGNLKMTFLKIEKVDGEMCAVIEMAGVVKGLLKQDEGNMNVELDLKGTTWRSLKTGLDVKESVAGKTTMKGMIGMDGGKSDITLAGPFRVEGRAAFKAVKKE